MYSNFTFPCKHSRRSMTFSVSLLLLFRARAAIPFARKPSTWSFIKDMRGETTMAVPSISRAGSW